VTILACMPILFSALLIAAHFFRAGALVLTAVSLLLPLLLLTRIRWVPQLLGIFLLLSAAEWLRTMLLLIDRYQEAGMNWHRMAIILGGVALFTVSSSLVFKTTALQRRFGRFRRRSENLHQHPGRDN
jgi:hypothetical protein